MKAKLSRRRLLKLTIFALTLLAVPLTILLVDRGHSSDSSVVSPLTPAPFILDTRIVAIANQLGLNQDYLRDAHATYGSTRLGSCDAAQSCYVESNGVVTIYLFPNTGDASAALALDHEYLHYIWHHQLTTEQRSQMCVGLTQLYEQVPALHLRMQSYVQIGLTGEALCNELHSVVGTEMRITELSPSWQAYYRQWTPHLDLLPSYY